MVKKKGKAKKEKKKKGKIKLKEEPSAENTERPTEKDNFETKVQALRERMEAVDERFHTSQGTSKVKKARLEREADVAKACVSHLMRKLQRVNEKREVAQERLLMEKDLGLLAERRTQDKVSVADKNHEAARSLFRWQKMELEGKLSLLEERRLTRDNQFTRLMKVEKTLADKLASAKDRVRYHDANHVGRLLRKRQKFIDMCKDIRSEWEEVFRLRMPVRAKEQLENNARLRGVCKDYTERLLQAQERNRILKGQQKSLQLETVIQSIGEEDSEKRKTRQESKLQHLLEVNRKLKYEENKMEDENGDPHQLVQECLMSTSKAHFATGRESDASAEDTSSEDTDLNVSSHPDNFLQLVQDCPMFTSKIDSTAQKKYDVSVEDTARKSEDDSQPERHAAGQKMSLIRQRKDDIYRVEDACRDICAILMDQAEYKRSLNSQFAKCIDKNGVKASAIVRAGKVFQDRCRSKVECEATDLGFEVVYQIRTLLDLSKEIG